jgi:hypothetical protein
VIPVWISTIRKYLLFVVVVVVVVVLYMWGFLLAYINYKEFNFEISVIAHNVL